MSRLIINNANETIGFRKDYSPHEIAATNAFLASGQAHDSSAIAVGPTANPLPGNRYSRMAHTFAAAAGNNSHGNSDKSPIYKGLLLHEAANRAHNLAIQYHENERWVYPNREPPSDFADRSHRDAANHHVHAAKAHEVAAREAAKRLGMDYNTHTAFRDAIRQHPEDASNRLIYADFLEDHGLEKEANKLRLDPSGHIGRARRAFRNLNGAEDADDIRIHRAGISLSARANRLGTKEAHRDAALVADRAESMMMENSRNAQVTHHDDLSGRYGRAAIAYRRLREYHQQQASKL